MKHKRYMHSIRQFGCRVLALLFIITLMTNLAGQTVLANTTGVSKEEVVYIKLKTDGSVDAIYVVNSFYLDEDGQIVDYGNYTAVRNLSTSGEIEVINNQIIMNAEKGRFEYQGTLNNTAIPWDVEIRYYLDGTELPAESLAGQSGALEVVISIARNPDGNSAFFENYALQISLTLDNDVCKNIVSEDATIASSGNNKQLSFIILPDKGTELSFTADVTDFEMDGIVMAGVNMNMDFELDEAYLEEETQELKDAVIDLDDGVGEIRDGTEELVDGVGDLKDGTEELVDGVTEMDDGILEMYDNMGEFVNGVDDLHDGVTGLAYGINNLCEGAEDLASGTWELGDGVNEIAEGLGSLTAQNDDLQALSQMLFEQTLAQDNGGITVSDWLADEGYPVDPDTTLEELNDYLSDAHDQGNDEAYNILLVLAYYKSMIAYMDGAAGLESGASQVSDGIYSLAEGSDEFTEGLYEIYDGVVAMEDGTAGLYAGTLELRNGIGDLKDGTGELLEGVIDLDDGVGDLYDGVCDLDDGMIELKDGTSEFREEIEDIDKTFADTIHDKVNEMLGTDFTPVSFVDERNTGVEAVQFVMKTEDIEAPDTEQDNYVEPETLTFWQRFTALFEL